MNPNSPSRASNECVRHHTRCNHVFKYPPCTSPRLSAHCLKSKRYTSLLFFLLLFMPSLQATQIKAMDEMRTVEVSISKQDLTRITVKEDRIQNVFGVAGEYVLETDENQGQIFIRPAQQENKKPFSLTLTTEKGRTQDLRLIPKDQPAEALILNPAEESQREISKAKKSPIFKEDVESLFEACRTGRIPLGYKSTPINLHSLQGQTPGPYKLIQELKGETLRCLTFEITNSLPPLSSEGKKQVLKLSEPQFAQSLPLRKHEVIAVLMPKHTLYPGEKTHVYVVARTD